jgi:hypothetical protein
MKNKNESGLARKVLGVGLVAFGLGANVNADMVIKTVSNPIWVEGQTYDVNVVANSQQHPLDKITSTQWKVYIADPGLIPAGANLPDNINNPSETVSDFFYDYTMQDNPGGSWNRVDSDFTSGVSTGNTRITANWGLDGPTDVEDKVLGKYSFTVPASLTGIYTFDLRDVEFVDSTLTKTWRSPDVGGGNGVVQVINQPITIVRDEQADFDKNGSVDNADYQHFAGCLTGPGIYDLTTNGCAVADFDFDSDVDHNDTAYFQRQYTGEGNPVQ